MMPQVEIIRSAKRHRTMSARLVGDRLEVRVPDSLSEADARQFAERMLQRFDARQQRRALDQPGELMRRALTLNDKYLGGQLRPARVEYVTNQRHRYGSCSPRNREIRLSHRLASMPPWVRDYVLIHELAHLREPNHSARFWVLVNGYELAERARGFLMGAGLEVPSTGDSEDGDLATEIDV